MSNLDEWHNGNLERKPEPERVMRAEDIPRSPQFEAKKSLPMDLQCREIQHEGKAYFSVSIIYEMEEGKEIELENLDALLYNTKIWTGYMGQTLQQMAKPRKKQEGNNGGEQKQS